jgi:hypothetical protein
MDDHLVLPAGRAMVEFLTFGITNNGVRATHTMIRLPGMSELEAHDLLQRINNVSGPGILEVIGLLDQSHGTFLVDIEVEMHWQPDDVLVKVIALLEAATAKSLPCGERTKAFAFGGQVQANLQEKE